MGEVDCEAVGDRRRCAAAEALLYAVEDSRRPRPLVRFAEPPREEERFFLFWIKAERSARAVSLSRLLGFVSLAPESEDESGDLGRWVRVVDE